MAALDKQPDNLNYLSPLGFRFILDRTPTVNYFAQGAAIPSLTLGNFDEETPLVALPYPGDKIRFAPFDITFRVDEDLVNYKEIFDWLNGLGYPESFTQRVDFVAQRTGSNLAGTGDNNVYSDGSLIIMTSAQNPNVRINFRDMFPIDLSTVQFNTTSQDVNYLEATATFRYSLYTIDLI